MQSILLYLGAFLIIAIPVMVFYRRHTVAKAEAEMRAQTLLQDTVINGVKTMRGADHNAKRQPMASNKKPKVERTTDNTPDDLLLFSNVHLASTPAQTSNYDDETRKIAGGGGTFDGGGSSADWSPSTSGSCEPSSGSTDSGSSSSSSDSGSCGSSD